MIDRELADIKQGSPRTWVQLAQLLDQIDRSQYWLRDCASMTQWINAHAEDFKLKPATLWRLLSSGRYLEGLRVRLTGGDKSVDSTILLDSIPDTVGPESVELLSKLERVVRPQDFRKLLTKVLNGEARRSHLREMWVALRPALLGQTARGRIGKPPKFNPDDPNQLYCFEEGDHLLALKKAGSWWTGVAKPLRFDLYLHVTPESFVLPSGCKFLFSAVAVVKPNDGRTQYHGVVFGYEFTKTDVWHDRPLELTYCDFLWHLIPKWILDINYPHGYVRSDGVGLLTLDERQELVMSCPATYDPKNGLKKEDLITTLSERS